MKIRHKESSSCYEITEAQGNYTLIDSQTKTNYNFSSCSDAIWKAIELLRHSNMESVTVTELASITSSYKFNAQELEKLLPTITKLEINKVYYDRLFMKMLANYKMVAEEMVISNKTNFYIKDEIAYLLRKRTGTSLGLRLIFA